MQYVQIYVDCFSMFNFMTVIIYSFRLKDRPLQCVREVAGKSFNLVNFSHLE